MPSSNRVVNSGTFDALLVLPRPRLHVAALVWEQPLYALLETGKPEPWRASESERASDRNGMWESWTFLEWSTEALVDLLIGGHPCFFEGGIPPPPPYYSTRWSNSGSTLGKSV